MSRRIVAAFAVAVAVAWISPSRGAFAQGYYPRGYGGYGWGGWQQQNPNATYMAGLGSYARGQGAYDVSKAEAQSINVDTVIKWNKALHARQKEIRAEAQVDEAREAAERDGRLARYDLENGATLNAMLMRIMDFDPILAKAPLAKAPLSPSAVREIPFRWDTEAITLCLDEMTASDAMPNALRDDRLAPQREALGQAVRAAIVEDAKGDVSPATMKRVSGAIADLRSKFAQIGGQPGLGEQDPEVYFTALAGMSRMLHDPGMKKALVLLEDAQDVTIGRLVAFMQAYNLRFGPATTPRQIEIYEGLAPALNAIAADLDAKAVATTGPALAKGGKPLQSAAKDVFKGMSWAQLEAQSNGP